MNDIIIERGWHVLEMHEDKHVEKKKGLFMLRMLNLLSK